MGPRTVKQRKSSNISTWSSTRRDTNRRNPTSGCSRSICQAKEMARGYSPHSEKASRMITRRLFPSPDFGRKLSSRRQVYPQSHALQSIFTINILQGLFSSALGYHYKAIRIITNGTLGSSFLQLQPHSLFKRPRPLNTHHNGHVRNGRNGS